MSDLNALSGVVFSPFNTASNVFIPDFTQPDGTIAAGGVVNIPDPGIGLFSDQDLSPTANISQELLAVDTSTTDGAVTSYRLGTAMLQDLVENTGQPDGNPLPVDIIAVTASEVLVGVGPYDPTGGKLNPPSFYPNGYILFSNNDLSLTDGNPNPPSFPITMSYSGDYVFQTPIPCFARGTLIGTPAGQVAVETLAVGDMVLTAGGDVRPVVWTGHRTVDVLRHPQPDTVRPIRIAAGAVSDSVPSRDLFVSPDHNLFIDGVLFPAKCLVNGTSVCQVDLPRITYHHVELESHDIVLADGMAAETYLDTGNRTSFVGEGATVAHPDFASAPDINFFSWEAKGCARLVLAGPELDCVRLKLAERAAARANSTSLIATAA